MTELVRTKPRPGPHTRPTSLIKPVTSEQVVIDEAVRTINRIYTAKGLETARAIGEYLLETFFQGDLAAFRRRGRKQVSFRRLAAREDLYPSASFLYHSVAIVEQLRQLPEDVAAALPLSHHKLLLPVRDPSVKRELATAAVTQGMSKRDLSSTIAERRRAEPARNVGGRPRIPVLFKKLRQLRQVNETLRTAPIPRAHLEEMPEEARAVLIEDLQGSLEDLALLRDRVQLVLDELAEG